MNADEMLFYADKRIRDALKGIPDDQYDTPNVCGVWSVKEILAHLAACERQFSEILQGFLEGGETPTLDRYAELGAHKWNAWEVASRGGLSVAEILEEYDQVYQHTRQQVKRIGEETLGKRGAIPWYGEQYALDDYIAYSQYGHKCEHGAQINVFKDLLNR